MIPLNKEELSGLKLIFGESEKDILKLDYYIIKNPPSEDYYPKLNIIEELNKIDTSNSRPFYDFYREYRKTMNLIKDINLLILGEEFTGSEIIIQFSLYSVCLPFKFEMDYDKNQEVKLFISEFSNCIGFYCQSNKA